MQSFGLKFSVAAYSAWAPGITTPEQWKAWAEAPFPIQDGPDPALRAMPAMLRRRAGALGKMALEVAYDCLDGQTGVPTVFCSRHGEVSRAVELLTQLSAGVALSPTGFGLAVHNASAGLFSIARADRANHIALAGGQASVEHAVVEACGLLADGAPMVLLVVYDCPLPAPLDGFDDCGEQSFAWAWLMTPATAGARTLTLTLGPHGDGPAAATAHAAMPEALEVLRFFASGATHHERRVGLQRWSWTRDV